MPTYGYVCDDCGAKMDIVHKMGITKKKCPECGKMKLRRSWDRIAAFHPRLSPAHPRANRGRGY